MVQKRATPYSLSAKLQQTKMLKTSGYILFFPRCYPDPIHTVADSDVSQSWNGLGISIGLIFSWCMKVCLVGVDDRLCGCCRIEKKSMR